MMRNFLPMALSGLYMLIFSQPLLHGSEQEEKKAKINFKHPGIMVNEKEVKSIRQAIQRGAEPQATAFKELMKAAKGYMQRKPDPLKEMFIPFYYDDKKKHIAARGSMDKDCRAVYALALASQLTGEAKYADKSLQFIKAWAKTCKIKSPGGDTPLMASRTLVLMVHAADLLWKHKRFRNRTRRSS